MKKVMYKKILLGIILFFSVMGLIRQVNAETVSTSLSVPYKETDDW